MLLLEVIIREVLGRILRIWMILLGTDVVGSVVRLVVVLL